jgi:hypothetical protein
MFAGVKKLLELKMKHNNSILAGDCDEVGVVTMDRLVL